MSDRAPGHIPAKEAAAGPFLDRDAIRGLVRTVPDFPEPGIEFRDITPLLANGPGLVATIRHLADHVRQCGADAVAGMEARGFIFGTGIAAALGIGFLPLRKPGKLPVATLSAEYELEYGSATLELDPTLVVPGQRVVIVDDLIATGGTALAAVQLLRLAGARVTDAAFVIDLPDLGGCERLAGNGVESWALLNFSGA
jgi:adenine phosphoribosyltransferase